MKKMFYIGLVLLIAGAAVAYYVMNKPHRDPSREEATEQISATDLGAAYMGDPVKGNDLYLDRVIEVSGTITSTDAEGFTLDNVVYCKMDQAQSANLTIGDKFRVKGRVVSYDELFGQVRLDFCVPI